MPRTLLLAVVVVLELVGWVWILQGIGVLPGSFMSGQIVWAVIGTMLVLIANGALLVLIRWSRRT
ncbi:MAG TPA: hypothetical protein VJP45_11890 [Candidatus Limnocylindria bacterium]|nr:hypothetical protein [Candidatus Limnocylindria bacterium]